jgi:hypothetical protein
MMILMIRRSVKALASSRSFFSDASVRVLKSFEEEGLCGGGIVCQDSLMFRIN